MKLISEAKHTEKRSKFIASFYQIESEQEAKRIIRKLRREHKKANHVCWAAVVDDKELFKNDGEVGHPANTMLSLLKSSKKRSHLLAVARYFGGVKLGSGGVKRAFKKAAQECLG